MLYDLPLLEEVYERKSPKDPDQAGIEIEVEFVSDQAVRAVYYLVRFQNWHIENDGSLRNGIEFKTKLVPYKAALTEIGGVFEAYKDQIRLSDRCSVHVHLNFGKNTVADVVNFTSLYACFEDHLDRISGRRKKNLYCLGIEHAYFDHRNTLSRMATAAVAGSTVIPQSNSLKYACVNYQRVFDLLTVEVRTMEATVDPKRIEQWVDILLEIKKASEGKDIKEFVKYLGGNPADICTNTFSKANKALIWSDPSAADMFRKGYYRVLGLLDNRGTDEQYTRRIGVVAKKRKLKKKAVDYYDEPIRNETPQTVKEWLALLTQEDGGDLEWWTEELDSDWNIGRDAGVTPSHTSLTVQYLQNMVDRARAGDEVFILPEERTALRNCDHMHDDLIERIVQGINNLYGDR